MDFKYNYLITEIADNDIEEILLYISDNLLNKIAAKNLWNKIQESLEIISIFPYAMPIYKEKYIKEDSKYRRLDTNGVLMEIQNIQGRKSCKT